MTKEQLVKLFDHTCLYAYATEAHMKKLCDEARAYNFAMVAVNSVQKVPEGYRRSCWCCHWLPSRPDHHCFQGF